MANQSPYSSLAFVKEFVSTDNKIKSGNGLTNLDDPTFLGFTLMFLEDSPLFNGALSGDSSNYGGANDTSPDDTVFSYGKSSNAKTTTTRPGGQSAVGYLESVGESKRANYLRAFCQGLIDLTKNRPYYFQTIEGLTEAFSKISKIGEDPYIGSSDGEYINIGCLEALDLKMTALFSLYKMAVYDFKYQRQIVPNNLLYFDVYVSVYEIRKFHTAQKVVQIREKNNIDSISNFINENTSTIKFKFKKCVWNTDVSSEVLTNVSNSEMGVAGSKIGWKYGKVLNLSNFSGYSNFELNEDESQKTSGNLSAIPKISDTPSGFDFGSKIQSLKSSAEDQLQRIEDNLTPDNILGGLRDRGEQLLLSRITRLAFGNVYGLVNRTLNALTQPNALANALAGASAQLESQIINGGGNNGSVPENNININTKILPAGNQPTNNDGGLPEQLNNNINIFGPGPSGPGPLNSDNIFRGD